MIFKFFFSAASECICGCGIPPLRFECVSLEKKKSFEILKQIFEPKEKYFFFPIFATLNFFFFYK